MKSYTQNFVLGLLFFTLSTYAIYAQSSFTKINEIFQAKCVSCHNTANAYQSGGLNLTGTEAEIYDRILNVSPVNAVAAAKGDKLISPGYPYRSFLLKKVAKNLNEPDCAISIEEGELMPSGLDAITAQEAELIRQWVIWGAPKTGSPVDISAINDYYTNGGVPKTPRPAAPAPGKGFQLHVGPIFIKQNDEQEYRVKFDPQLPAATEITRLNMFMSDESHHLLLYKFKTQEAVDNQPEGLRDVNLLALAFDTETDLIVAWQDNYDHRLPAGTAYFWDENTVLDVNYHIPNFSGLGVLPAEAYLNIYTQPTGTALKEMKAGLQLYQGQLGGFFIIPPGNTTLKEAQNNGVQWNLWQITSHTHKYGVDYDVYENNNGGEGTQIFEGQDDGGVYSWEHPPVKLYEPYYVLPANKGFYHKAKFNNTSNSIVTFGLTTADEMMITFLQYTEGETLPFVAIKNINTTYCINEGIINFTLMPDNSGVLAGPGVVGTSFSPASAGLGTHTITYTYNYQGQNIVDSYDVTVIEAPQQPTVIQDGAYLVAPNGFEMYQWYLNGEIIEGATGITYEPTQSGAYSVQVKPQGVTCTVSSKVFNFESVGINKYSHLQHFTVSPNPFKQITKISYGLDKNSNVKIMLLNLVGQTKQVLYDDKQVAGKHNITIDAKQLNLLKGMYFVSIEIDGTPYIQKIMIQ